MVKSIRFGDHWIFKWEDIELGPPKEGEVLVKFETHDISFHAVDSNSCIQGIGAVGVVKALGSGVTGIKPGDRVAYYDPYPTGLYVEEQILSADKVALVPRLVLTDTAMSLLLKGMMTQFLLCSCFQVKPEHMVLIHPVAAGVGSIMCQWAKAIGATVIGTVLTKEQAAQAKEYGCHHTILYKEEDLVSRVDKITSGQGVEVVYDFVGQETFQRSLDCLKTRGYMVSVGPSLPDPLPVSVLAAKSLFFTRPSLIHYASTPKELKECIGEVLSNVELSVLRDLEPKTSPPLSAVQHSCGLSSN
ncbi:PREDICTED: uncharacterized protein LOC109146492 [Ipomoea nil]|uniref:uncharacterized protein LOC109146492 n=1 Tax=Ipomoea nil TaxID=35883 RepID=UPI00090129D0|nr:PREDICTED: uncharacterized protein LOC109146492 [Ipomoea nil]